MCGTEVPHVFRAASSSWVRAAAALHTLTRRLTRPSRSASMPARPPLPAAMKLAHMLERLAGSPETRAASGIACSKGTSTRLAAKSSAHAVTCAGR